MNITEVTVYLRSSNALKAYVNIVIDDAFVVKNIKIIEGKKGLFISMPSQKRSKGEFVDIAHPINTETRDMLKKVIMDKYYEEVEAAKG